MKKKIIMHTLHKHYNRHRKNARPYYSTSHSVECIIGNERLKHAMITKKSYKIECLPCDHLDMQITSHSMLEDALITMN